MLRFVVRLMSVVFLLWMAISGGLNAIARGRPGADYGMTKYGFATCNLPCWAGVTPGQTALDAIVPLMEKNIPALKSLRVYSPGSIYFEMGRMTSTILHSQGEFHAIHLEITDLSLFYLIEQMGSPACVLVMPGDGLILIWEVGGFSVSTILWDAPADVLQDETAQTQYLDISGQPACDTTVQPWRGFVPLWFYERLAAAPV